MNYFLIFTLVVSTHLFAKNPNTKCDHASLIEISTSSKELTTFFDHLSVKATDSEESVMDIFTRSIDQFSLGDNLPKNYIVIDPINNLRVDLMAKDFIDQVELILNNNNYQELLEDLKITLGDQPIKNFRFWYEKLIEHGELDKKLKGMLNKKIVFQIYDASGVALLHSNNVSAPNLRARILRNQSIARYNEVALDPEGQALLHEISVQREPFSTETLTVTKITGIDKRTIKKSITEYYEKFCTDLLSQPGMSTKLYEVQCDPNRSNKVRLHVNKGAPLKIKEIVKPLFEGTYNSHKKLGYFQILSSINESDFNRTPVPSDFLENFDLLDEKIKEQTYEELLAGGNDETTLILRKWIKTNYKKILERLSEYNLSHEVSLSFEINNPKRVRLFEALEQYETLIKLFPDAPWIEGQEFTIITPGGKKVITGKNFLEKLAFHSKNLAKSYLSPDSIASYGVGTGVAFLTGGNVMAGAITKSIVKDALSGFYYDKKLSDAFKGTPFKIISSIVNSAGFTHGEIPLAAFSGSVSGGLRSLLTGQDLQKGAIVGAGFGTLRSTLPYDIAYPSISLEVREGLTHSYAAKAISLDVTTNAFYQSAQGALVAAWEREETALSGAIKGAAYGTTESLVLSSMFGIRYDMFGLIPEEKISKQFKQESNYHPEVDTYGIKLKNKDKLYDDFWDAADGVPYRISHGRWGWFTEYAFDGDTSFSSPWFVTGPVGHYGGAGTIAHEVSHQIQLRDLGGANFLIGYTVESMKDGTLGTHINSEKAERLSDRDFNKYEQYQSHGFGK